MSRFLPDDWSGVLWRSFEMADFRSGLYVETIAPDVRPAAFLVALALTLGWWGSRRVRKPSKAPQTSDRLPSAPCRRSLWTLQAGWLVGWFAWLMVSGNGRYVLPLLLLLGPLLAVTIARLPIHGRKRWLLLALIVGAQAVLLHSASPSHAWAKLKVRWEGPHPMASREELLGPLHPDLILVMHSQTMTALLVETPSAAQARLGSLRFTNTAGVGSSEHQAMRAAIAEAQHPVLLESFILDQIKPEDVDQFTWRIASVGLLAQEGLAVEPASCRRMRSDLNVLQVACALKRIDVPLRKEDPRAAAPAEAAMARLVRQCSGVLGTHSEREVQGDGSLIQIFKEGRYVILADAAGAVHVKLRSELNFRTFWQPSDGAIERSVCSRLSRSEP